MRKEPRPIESRLDLRHGRIAMSVQRLSAALTLTIVLLSVSGSVRAVEKPNILFIMGDDLGKDGISCYGADGIETPHVDRLAANGMKFTNAWSMPQCTPTRVTLLTGQYPWRTGWVNHWDTPRWGVCYFDWEKYTTFATLVKRAGYKTAIAGKWQINDFRLEPKALEKHGFDDWCMWTGYEAQNPPSGKRFWDPYIHTREGSKTWAKKFGPDVYCDFLIDFMKRHRDEPMCLYFPMALTHGPLVTTPKEPDASSKMGKMHAMIRYTDHLVGRLVSTLEELKIRDRTIVIFTTDNGTSRGVQGRIRGDRPSGGKASKYEGGVCEPFIVSAPGLVPKGVTTDALTDFSDLLPTFCELAGAKVPEKLEIDGRSIAPLLLGKVNDSPRDWILALGHGPARLDEKGTRGKHDYASRVLRDKRFKVWVGTDRKIEALYDLQADPLEQKNMLESERPDVAEAKRKFQKLVDAMPTNDARPAYRPRAANAWDRKFGASAKPAKPKKNRQGRKSRKQGRKARKSDD